MTDTVCDNTREAALAEDGQQFKVKHSRYSSAQLGPVREALAMVHTMADDSADEVRRLCRVEVTEQTWKKFLDNHVPLTGADGCRLDGRALTHAERKRAVMERLYRHDDRVAPWTGTAHGVIQAVNTYEHHEGIVRGHNRAERNMLRTINGTFDRLDRTTKVQLEAALA